MTYPTFTLTAAGLMDVQGKERQALLLESDFTDAIKAGAKLMFQEVAIVPADELARLTAEVERLRHQINEASDPDFLWGAMDNVTDMDTTLMDYAQAASRAIRAAISDGDAQ